MAKKKRSRGNKQAQSKGTTSFKDILSLYSKIADLKRQADSFSSANTRNEDRLANLEIHLSLLTRLLTTLCIDKFGMKMGVLKRLVRKVEKEAIRDSQILELESLYKLSPDARKKPPSFPAKPEEDPWDQIS